MGTAFSEARIKPVHRARVDNQALGCGDNERKKDSATEIDAAPSDRECAVPVRTFVEHAPAAGDPGVVENSVDVVGVEVLKDCIAKRLEVGLARYIGVVNEDVSAGCLSLHDRHGFFHVFDADITGRDPCPLCCQLTDELTTHARSAAGDDNDLVGKAFHQDQVTFTGRVL